MSLDYDDLLQRLPEEDYEWMRYSGTATAVPQSDSLPTSLFRAGEIPYKSILCIEGLKKA